MIVLLVRWHGTEFENFVDVVKSIYFRMMIAGRIAVRFLCWFLQVRWIVLLDCALPSARYRFHTLKGLNCYHNN